MSETKALWRAPLSRMLRQNCKIDLRHQYESETGRTVQAVIDVIEGRYGGDPAKMPYVVNKEAFARTRLIISIRLSRLDGSAMFGCPCGRTCQGQRHRRPVCCGR
jgi:hypothetical protein